MVYKYIILLFFLICMLYFYNYLYFNSYIKKIITNTSIKEPFSSSQTFILLGDSILKNDAYVTNGKSVDDLLTERTNGNTICFAKDDSKIMDVYTQINNISNNLNNYNTTILLSIGGNDILSSYAHGNDVDKITSLAPIFKAYIKLVKSIREKFPKIRLVLFDIYYPENIKYQQYHPTIQKWNKMLYGFTNAKYDIYDIFKISNILTHKDDFTLDIEPSSIGSQKLVDAIMTSY